MSEGRAASKGREFLAGALAVCLAVVLFCPVAYLLVSKSKVAPPDSEALARLALVVEDIHPEPGEKLAYFLSLVFFPLAVPWLMLRMDRRNDFLKLFERISAVLAGLALAAMLLGPNHTCYLRYSWLGLSLPWRMLGAGLLYLAWRRCAQPSSALAGSLVAATLLSIVLTGFLRSNDPYVVHSHFNAVYYSMVQIYEGRILLVDFFNQYGLYPYFLLPLFRLIGLSVEKFSLVMGLLAAINFGCIYLVLRNVCCNRAVALLGFLACANVNYFAMKQLLWREHVLELLDPYFQYWPIRSLFPTMMLLWVARPVRRQWLGTLLFSAGCFGNLDSGLPAWGTWLATLGYAEFLRPIPRRESLRNALLQGFKGVACLVVVAGLLHSRLSLPGLVHIHKVFYGIGYLMLPMQPVHAWNVVALLYLAGLAYAFQAARERRDELRPKVVFALSILGMGLFSYFQGRSHDWVLFLASWPATMLATVFLDELWARAGGGSLRGALRALLTVLLLNFAVSLPGAVGSLAIPIERKLSGRAVLAESHILNEEIAQLEKHSEYPRQMVILSNHSAMLHQLTHSQFLAFDSLIEMFRIDEFVQLAAVIEAKASPQVIVSYEFERESQKIPWQKLVWTALERNYQCIESSANARLRIYTPKG